MSWGGASMYIDEETGILLLPAEVAMEEFIMWREILQKLRQKDEESAETIH